MQARKGYYAPVRETAAAQAKREEAVSPTTGKGRINVLVQVDVRQMQFKKAEGRNLNELTVVAAVFDRDANLLDARSNTVNMHIKDETLATGLDSGIALRSSFDLGPGSYVVRIVARDEQGKMTTHNQAVNIP